MYQGIEKLQTTRNGDFLTIGPQFAESVIAGAALVKLEPIIFGVNDTTWKFDEFLKRNRGSVHSDSLGDGSMGVTFYVPKIYFKNGGLGDKATFMVDYCNTIKNIILNSTYHIYAGTAINGTVP